MTDPQTSVVKRDGTGRRITSDRRDEEQMVEVERRGGDRRDGTERRNEGD